MKPSILLTIILISAGLGVSVSAAELGIVSCDVRSRNFQGLRLKLVANDEGKLVARYSIQSMAYYDSPHLVVPEVDTLPAQFPKMLAEVNAWRDTGIDAAKVTKFQNLFIDGDDRSDIELWKLLDASNQTLGWVVYAYGGMRGCYPLFD